MPEAVKAAFADSDANALAGLIAAHERDQPGFWDFADVPRRAGGHAFFQYPAMMVPELQGTLLDDLLAVDPDVGLVYDPFMGSGTVLLEAIYRGLDFFGVDINPMAVLLSQVKASPPTEVVAVAAVNRVVADAKADVSAPFDFPNINKWFEPSVIRELSQVRAAICKQSDIAVRRFLWICLAETIRLVSNSRTSTVKLHAYSATQRAARNPQALTTFEAVGLANAKRCSEHWTRIVDATDSTVRLQRGSVLDDLVGPKQCDVIMTSPPYGDNDTTVTYGQHSYLPLRWIEERDLVGNLEPGLLASTGRIDTLSLGGSIRGALEARDGIAAKSAALAAFLDRIDGRLDLVKKVVAFATDYEGALARASQSLKIGGFAFWTLGERRVGNISVPLVAMTSEFLASHGHEHVQTITRELPKRRRMASSNGLGSTMNTEYVLVTSRAR